MQARSLFSDSLISLFNLQRKNKYTDARLKALKAKNEYQLCLEASNTTIHKYFVEDLSDLIDVRLNSFFIAFNHVNNTFFSCPTVHGLGIPLRHIARFDASRHGGPRSLPTSTQQFGTAIAHYSLHGQPSGQAKVLGAAPHSIHDSEATRVPGTAERRRLAAAAEGVAIAWPHRCR